MNRRIYYKSSNVYQIDDCMIRSNKNSDFLKNILAIAIGAIINKSLSIMERRPETDKTNNETIASHDGKLLPTSISIIYLTTF